MERSMLGFIDFFKGVPDHRLNRRKLYCVEEILLVAFCGMIAGCDSWNDLELFGKTKLAYLRRYLPYKNGTPSDDTFRRFFRALDPEIFEACFMKWVRSFQLEVMDKVIAVDGKTSRRSFDGTSRPMHLVSAFVSELGITLGQLKTADKSNEITAVPELLNVLDIAGAIVTLDSMGCQSRIVETIIDKKADYLIALKGNQSTLNKDVRLFFEHADLAEVVIKTEVDKGHGRIETRQCRATENIAWLRERHPKWQQLKSIIEIESQREIQGEIQVERRYYISSLAVDVEKISNAVRQHWGIENKLHWVLDIVFQDDQCRIRQGNAPRNIAIIKKTTLNLLQMIKKERPRVSFKAMRKLAGWDHDFLDSILIAQF